MQWISQPQVYIPPQRGINIWQIINGKNTTKKNLENQTYKYKENLEVFQNSVNLDGNLY